MTLAPWMIKDIVKAALIEDVGRGDLTTQSIIDQTVQCEATLLVKQSGILCGIPLFYEVFKTVDPEMIVSITASDGDHVETGDLPIRLTGAATSILTAERVALNFIQRMSGIATATYEAVRQTKGTQAIIVDTRKTTPGLRKLEKYAVRMGGGRNHRYGLDDALMIKDNHITVAGGITQAVKRAREKIGHMHKIEVEASNLEQVKEALHAGADVILLDNMDLGMMQKAVQLAGGRVPLEASGGITPSDVQGVAQTGVDVISLGWITHSAPALDLSLNVRLQDLS